MAIGPSPARVRCDSMREAEPKRKPVRSLAEAGLKREHQARSSSNHLKHDTTPPPTTWLEQASGTVASRQDDLRGVDLEHFDEIDPFEPDPCRPG